MIDDLETFIAEQKSKLSKEKQELKTEPRISTNPEAGRRKWNIPSNDQSNFMPMPRSTNKEHFYHKPPTPEAGIATKLGTYADKRQKLQEERRDEYNRFLAEQNFVRGVNPKSNNFSAGPPQNDSFGASIPGLRNHRSAELRKMAERNREYNEMLRNQKNLQKSPLSTRKGYESPVLSYEEILRRKRSEETNYRRHNDPDYYDLNTNLADSQKHMSSSDGNLSRRPQQEDPRFAQEQLEPKKVTFGSTSQLPNGSGNVPNSIRSRRVDPNTEHFNATLLIGERLNDDPHKKEAYRKELLTQMEEAEALRKREKFESRQAFGDIFSGRNHDRRPKSWPTQEVTSGHPDGAKAGVGAEASPGAWPGATQMPAIPQSYLRQQKPDENLPRNAYKIDGILANGFEFDLSRQRYHHPLAAPSGVPLPAVPSLLPYNSQINDAYFHYANQNPLDPNLATGPANGVPLGVPSQPLPSLSALQQPQNEVESRPSHTRHNASVERPTHRTFGFSNDDDDRKQATQEKNKLYQQELQKQMAEDKLKKLKEQQEKERYDKKLEAEIANYNPFGRGGGGAPVKDLFGNVVTSRNLGSLVHHEPRPVVVGLPDSQRTARSDPAPSSDLYQSPFKEAEKSASNFARGGNGIFGEPMTREQKNSRLEYQRELQLQIEEKRLEKEKEKEKMKREDELREQRIQEDALKAAKESEEAAKKEREKQEQLKQDQLAVKLKAEERKRLEEQRKREEQEAERERLRREEENRRQRKEAHKPRSPPISSAFGSRHNENQDRTGSPPIRAKRTLSRQSQGSNHEALERLATLAKKLQVDRRNVEEQQNEDRRNVEKQRNTQPIVQPEIFDPRIILRTQNMRPNYSNVFELAKAGRPASVRRGPAVRDPSSRPLFNNNRYSNLSDDLVEPLSESEAIALERSQRAVLLAQQEEMAEINKENSKHIDDEFSPSERPSSNLLRSTTDYLALPSYDLDEGAQFLPRGAVLQGHQPLNRTNSKTSLILGLTQENKARERRVKSLRGDDWSNDDPEEMLEKFMLQQTRRRPPSADTHNGSSWALPSTGH